MYGKEKLKTLKMYSENSKTLEYYFGKYLLKAKEGIKKGLKKRHET